MAYSATGIGIQWGPEGPPVMPATKLVPQSRVAYAQLHQPSVNQFLASPEGKRYSAEYSAINGGGGSMKTMLIVGGLAAVLGLVVWKMRSR
jgi:hypothetical protein